MRTFALWSATALIIAALACTRGDSAREWREIITMKKNIDSAVSPGQRYAFRQHYADALSHFVEKNPDNHAAEKAYADVCLDFAQDLVAIGRIEESLPYFRLAVAYSQSATARAELKQALLHRKIDHDELGTIPPEMTADEVQNRLGVPRPGWKRPTGTNGEIWYYPTESGGLATVFFVQSRVVATDYGAVQDPAKTEDVADIK